MNLLSVVIPVKDEQPNIRPLADRLREALAFAARRAKTRPDNWKRWGFDPLNANTPRQRGAWLRPDRRREHRRAPSRTTDMDIVDDHAAADNPQTTFPASDRSPVAEVVGGVNG